MSKNVTTFKVAPARTGKSFITVRQLVDEYLPQTHLDIWTNLPLKRVKIARFCEQKFGMDRLQTLKRLHRIPRDVLASWKANEKITFDKNDDLAGKFPNHGRGREEYVYDGPWLFFARKKVSNALIIIDEVHNYCGKATPKQARVAWQRWLGELGHNQSQFICISQDANKVEREIRDEAGAMFHISNTGLERDPLFKIEMYDWIELMTAFLGLKHKVFVFEQEVRKVEGKAKLGERRSYLMGEPYFDFYDSFNAPIEGNKAAGVKQFETQFEKMKRLHPGFVNSRVRLLLWFVGRNFNRLFTKFAIALMLLAGLAALFTGFATDWMLTTMTKAMSSGMPTMATKDEAKKEPPPAVTVKPLPSNPSGALPNTRPQVDPAEQKIKQLEKDIEAVRQQRQQLEDERKRLESVAIITPESVTLHNGMTYRIGEVVPRGLLQDMKLIRIDWPKREAEFHHEKTGTVLVINLFN